jgi:poly-gamma-glutamate capsule biosynthesis protein CapA/YwtB (metallophosphatase superfamily)
MPRIFLSGDVMTGRGIDQALPFPGDPRLFESHVKDARAYVTLAEQAHGEIIQPVSFKHIWGDALSELHRANIETHIINLETSITASATPWPKKPIHYKMHPRNIGCLTAAKITACALANNHVLDWHYAGLLETLETLDHAGIAHAGAGRNLAEARAPATIPCDGKRILLFSMGSITSGIPPDWAATNNKPGVYFLDDLSATTAKAIAANMRIYQQPGDIVIASIHWGANWGYEIEPDQIEFGRTLIDEGVALVHGHSSHHIKTLEIYNDHLILYGCGDLITDYEGITGYEMFRSDLAFLYFADLAGAGRLESLRLIPVQMRRFQLRRASRSDSEYLFSFMNDICSNCATQFQLIADDTLLLNPHSAQSHHHLADVPDRSHR